jgi:hypothetical protein
MRRASNRSAFCAPIHLSLHEFELCNLTFGLSVRPSGYDCSAHGRPVFYDAAKGATRLNLRAHSRASSSAPCFFRIMAWQAAMTLRASTSSGTPLSIAAIATDSDLESVSRPVVISRAMVLAEGTRRKLEISAFSARPPSSPFGNHPQISLDLPGSSDATKARSRCKGPRSIAVEPGQIRLLSRVRNTSERWPRRILRTSPGYVRSPVRSV